MRRRNLLIWGAGKTGEKVYAKLCADRKHNIIAFGDNDRMLTGTQKFGRPVIGVDDLKNLTEIEAVIIAVVEREAVKKQLSQIIDVPIYNEIDELMYSRIAVDISGFCNARCKWCVTGRANRDGSEIKQNYMNYQKFTDLYHHLYDSGIIEKTTEIMLYSWGEPLLNPDYARIVEFLASKNQIFSVSTNASVIQTVKSKDAYKNCCSFIFSMPGFSQESYNRMHGFQFEKIKENIIKLNKNLKEHGFSGDGSISFHVYQFNHDEIMPARQFSKDLDLRFNPYYPYFNGNSMTEEFLENRMDAAVLQEAEKELHISHVDELIKNRPENYHCFLENILSVDWKGNFVLCCAADLKTDSYEWESAFEINSFEQMRKRRANMMQCQSCQKCRQLGIDYWMGNNSVYQDI